MSILKIVQHLYVINFIFPLKELNSDFQSIKNQYFYNEIKIRGTFESIEM